MYSFPYLEPVCCSMSGFNSYFLTCIQVSQETRKVVWYSHLFKHFPQFVVIHTVKGFSVVNDAEVDVRELICITGGSVYWQNFFESQLVSLEIFIPFNSEIPVLNTYLKKLLKKCRRRFVHGISCSINCKSKMLGTT